MRTCLNVPSAQNSARLWGIMDSFTFYLHPLNILCLINKLVLISNLYTMLEYGAIRSQYLRQKLFLKQRQFMPSALIGRLTTPSAIASCALSEPARSPEKRIRRGRGRKPTRRAGSEAEVELPVILASFPVALLESAYRGDVRVTSFDFLRDSLVLQQLYYY